MRFVSRNFVYKMENPDDGLFNDRSLRTNLLPNKKRMFCDFNDVINLKGTDTEISESESDLDSSFTDSESDDDCVLNEAPTKADNNNHAPGINNFDIIDISSSISSSYSSHSSESPDSFYNTL